MAPSNVVVWFLNRAVPNTGWCFAMQRNLSTTCNQQGGPDCPFYQPYSCWLGHPQKRHCSGITLSMQATGLGYHHDLRKTHDKPYDLHHPGCKNFIRRVGTDLWHPPTTTSLHARAGWAGLAECMVRSLWRCIHRHAARW